VAMVTMVTMVTTTAMAVTAGQRLRAVWGCMGDIGAPGGGVGVVRGGQGRLKMVFWVRDGKWGRSRDFRS
jgi:hypothetical protein